MGEDVEGSGHSLTC